MVPSHMWMSEPHSDATSVRTSIPPGSNSWGTVTSSILTGSLRRLITAALQVLGIAAMVFLLG